MVERIIETAAFSFIVSIGLLTIAKLFILPLTAITAIVCVSAALLIVLIVSRQSRQIDLKVILTQALKFLVIFILLLGLIAATHKNFFVKDSDYLDASQSWNAFSNLGFDDNIVESDKVKAFYASGMRKSPYSWLQATDFSAQIEYKNLSSLNIEYNLKYFIKNISCQETKFSLYHNGVFLGEGKLPSSYNAEIHNHDYAANNYFLSLPLVLSPGRNLVRMEFENNSDSAGRISILDLTLTTRRQFYRAVENNFIIADASDIREDLNLIKSLKKRLYIYEDRGLVKDGRASGLATFDAFPLYYYAAFIFSLIFGQTVMVYNIFCVVLLSLVVMVCTILMQRSQELPFPKSLFMLAALIAAAFIYSLFIASWGFGAVFNDTFFLLVFLVFLLGLKNNDFKMTLIFGIMAILTEFFAFSTVIMAFLAFFILRPQSRQFLLRSLFWIAVAAILLALTYLFLARKAGTLDDSLFEFKFAQGEHLSLLRLFFSRPFYTIMIIAAKFITASFFMMLVGGFLGLFSFRTKDNFARVLWLITLFYIFWLSLINRFQIYHLAPVVFLPVMAGLSEIASLKQDKARHIRYVVFSFLFLSASAAVALNCTSDYTGNNKGKFFLYPQALADDTARRLRGQGRDFMADVVYIDDERIKESSARTI